MSQLALNTARDEFAEALTDLVKISLSVDPDLDITIVCASLIQLAAAVALGGSHGTCSEETFVEGCTRAFQAVKTMTDEHAACAKSN
jgi:hypothetical protein